MADVVSFPPPHVIRPPKWRRFLTNPESDPLGLAAELYFARTGMTDYAHRLANQDEPGLARGDVTDPTTHPFVNIYLEHARFNALLQELGAQERDPDTYSPCRNRWHKNLEGTPGYAKTSHCMRVFCPACWMYKVELAYAALAGAQAPVLGVIDADFNLVESGECLTQKGLRTLVTPSERLSSRDRDKAWQPLFWALFPIIGNIAPMYRFVGLFVASQVLNRKSHWGYRTPAELAEHGTPRDVETTTGHSVAWEKCFTGPDRTNDAWRAFRRLTPAPMITTTEDGLTPGYTDGDAIMAEVSIITLQQTRRSYLGNQGRYARLIVEPSPLTDLKPNVDEIEDVYADIRLARKAALARKLMCEASTVEAERCSHENVKQRATDSTRE